ncbi:MAG: inositol monophosphatase [Aphanocapsa feldmannii 288cV]|nr:MAG: inositol monophosphatase [Aphanocapsa feldmannii 288cV]
MAGLEQRRQWLAIAIEAAAAGAAELRRHYGQLRQVREKGRAGDLLSEADLAAEAAVLQVLHGRCPELAVLAEESGGTAVEQGGLLWCVDPLDGTTNYAHGYPFFATSVGLVEDGTPLLGCIDVPFMAEVFEGGPGLGARCNGAAIRVSDTKALADSLLVTGFAYDRIHRADNNYAEFCRLTQRCHGVRRGGAAAVDLAYTACGRLDGYWERGLKPWDLAAGSALISAAGGCVTAYDRSPFVLSSGHVLASNGHLQQAISEQLQASEPLDPTLYGC